MTWQDLVLAVISGFVLALIVIAETTTGKTACRMFCDSTGAAGFTVTPSTCSCLTDAPSEKGEQNG